MKNIFSALLYSMTCLIIFGSVNWIGRAFLTWFAEAMVEKQLVVFLMSGSMIWILLGSLKNLLVNFAVRIGTGKNLAVVVIFIFSLWNGYVLTAYTWGHFKSILTGILLTLLILEITLSPLQDVPGLLKTSPGKRRQR